MITSLRRWWYRTFVREYLIPETTWADYCRRLPLLRYLSPEQRVRLHAQTSLFLHTKEIHGARGFEVSDEMRWLVAVQACVPVLNIGLHWYDGWSTVLIYPTRFWSEHEYTDEFGVTHRARRPLSGEANLQGPVVLSWEDVEADALDEHENLVIHEFSHKLDMRNGRANGMPPLHRGMHRPAWTEALSQAYEDLSRRVEQGESLDFDPYAATDPAEFFAVFSEVFFLQPGRMRWAYPEVLEQMRQFYQWPETGR